VHARGLQAVSQRRRADEFEGRVHAAGHQFAHSRRDRAVVGDDVVDAGLAQRARLGLRARRGQNGEAAALGEDRGGQADRRRAAADQQRLTGLHVQPDGQRPVRGLEHLGHGSQRRPRQVAAERDRLRDRHARELRVAAIEAAAHPAHHRDDLLADGQFAARAGGDDAGRLDPWHARERDLGVAETEPGLQFGAVQPEGLDLDEDPAGLGLGHRALADDKRVGRRGDGVQDDGAHGGGERSHAYQRRACTFLGIKFPGISFRVMR
jgi:hypothetical protein